MIEDYAIQIPWWLVAVVIVFVCAAVAVYGGALGDIHVSPPVAHESVAKRLHGSPTMDKN